MGRSLNQVVSTVRLNPTCRLDEWKSDYTLLASTPAMDIHRLAGRIYGSSTAMLNSDAETLAILGTTVPLRTLIAARSQSGG